MQRRPDWLPRLSQFVESRKFLPFEWGRNDCALFVCDAVLATTGTDMGEMVRGQYDSEESARAKLASLTDGGYLAEYASLIARRHALKSVGWQHLRRGDVGLIGGNGNAALGLVLMDGRSLGVFVEGKGFETLPIRMAKMGWLIG